MTAPDHGGSPGPSRWAAIAAGPERSARADLEALGIRPAVMATKRDVLVSPRRWRRRLSDEGVDALAVHSACWDRQINPQLYDVALALAPVRRRYRVDGRSLTVTAVPRTAVARTLTDCAAGAAAGAAEVARFSRERRRARRHGRAPAPPREHAAVLAVWRGSADASVGGSVTHMSGVLGGFRRLGLRVGLLTAAEVPAQLAGAVDEVVVLPPLPRHARVTRGLEWLLLNDAMREAGPALLRRLGASLIYQRHDALLTAGGSLARECGVPLVLEWNSSETWIRRNWESLPPHARALDALVDAMERHVVASADAIVAVSRHAADMALALGGDPGRVSVVPNGVDVDEIPAPRHREANGHATLGWVGSFGAWHGADVAVRALARLPDGVRLVMIGDGPARESSRTLATDLGVDHRIEWTGAVPHALAVDRLGACDVLVSPHVGQSDRPFFGSPTKIFEYMAVGRPIVASRLEQIGEILEDGRTARLVEPGDAEGLADAVAGVLASADRGRALGLAARREAAEKHRWDQRAAAILATLRPDVAGVAPREESP